MRQVRWLRKLLEKNKTAEIVLAEKPKSFSIYSGDDLLTYPLMCCGASGVISVTANCYPNKVQSLCKSILDAHFIDALQIHNELIHINKGLFLDVNPICIKFYMNLLGENVGGTRLPLTKPSKDIQQKLIKIKSFYEN